MANRDNPHGLVAVGTEYGGPWRVREFKKLAAYGTAVFINDAVNQAAGSATGDPLPVIEASATPGTTRYSGISLSHSAALTAAKHLVIVSRDVIFEVQDNNDTDGVGEADLGLNSNLELNAGSATTLISGHELDESSLATTATLDIKVLDLYRDPENAFGSGFVRVLCKFNKHRNSEGVAGV